MDIIGDKLLIRIATMIIWEFPAAPEVFAIGWAGGECRYEISRTAIKTHQGFSYQYGLWSPDPDDAQHNMVNVQTSPWPSYLIRQAENIEVDALADEKEALEYLDKTDAEFSN